MEWRNMQDPTIGRNTGEEVTEEFPERDADCGDGPGLDDQE